MGEAVGGLVQQGAEDVDGAAVEAFAADQNLGPVAGGVGAGELPSAGGEVAEIQPPAAGVAARGDHDHDLGDLGVAVADGGPSVFQGGDQAAGGGPVDRWGGGHEVASGSASTGAGRRPLCSTVAGGRAWNWATRARA
jgi:hypothetical protein